MLLRFGDEIVEKDVSFIEVIFKASSLHVNTHLCE